MLFAYNFANCLCTVKLKKKISDGSLIYHYLMCNRTLWNVSEYSGRPHCG